jgi:hypothetical protein
MNFAFQTLCPPSREGLREAEMRARVDLESRAGEVGVEAEGNKNLVPTTLLGLFFLCTLSPAAATAGLAIFVSISRLRAWVLESLKREEQADKSQLAELKAEAANAEKKIGSGLRLLANLETARASRTQKKSRKEKEVVLLRGALPHLCLFPRLIAIPAPARASARAATE